MCKPLLYLCGPVCVLQCHLLSGSPGQGGNRDLVSLSAGLVLKNTTLIKEAPALILHTQLPSPKTQIAQLKRESLCVGEIERRKHQGMSSVYV